MFRSAGLIVALVLGYSGSRAENLQDRTSETVEGYPVRGLSWFAEVKVGW
jgi:hypothetical protein